MAASLFLELLKVFGDLEQQIQEKIRYAKWKATDISRALKEGRTPAAGPPVGEDGDSNYQANNEDLPDMTSGGIKQPQNTTQTLPLPSSQTAAVSKPPAQTAAPVTATAPAADKNYKTVSQLIDPHLSETVQKHCRYTISALQYDDLPTAIGNLEKALAILQSVAANRK